MTKQQERFESLQARFAAIEAKEEAFRSDVLLRRYGKLRPPESWLTRTERTKLESLKRRQDLCGESFFALLDRIGGRYWRSPAPYYWILRHLSYADATTTGALSVVPPASYGSSERDMQAFAAALI